MTEVSICIPAYKQEKLLKRLLDSIFIQTYTDYSVVITDDSDDDLVKEVVARYPQEKIVYKKNSTQAGTPENWNRAINLAQSKYVKIMHHDDWFSNKESLGKFVNMIQQSPDADFAFCGSLNVSSIGKKTHAISVKQASNIKKNPKSLFLGNFIGAPSATIFMKNRLEFDKNLKWLVDIDFYIRFLSINANFVYTTDTLVSIGIHDKQVTKDCINNNSLIVSESLYLFDKLGLHKDRKCKNQLSKLLTGTGVSFTTMRKNSKVNIVDSIFIVMWVKLQQTVTIRLARNRLACMVKCVISWFRKS